MAIDWDALRRRGEAGLLTADETDALVRLAMQRVDSLVESALGYATEFDFDFCPWCWTAGEHGPDCPIEVLESANNNCDWRERWEL